MVRCFNCQIKISLSESVCPYCGRVPWDGAVDIFASGDKVLLRYNGTEKDVCVPDGIVTIGYMAFEDTCVRSVVIPEGVLKIEEAAFYSCESLNNVIFPQSIKYIGKNAFSDCIHLTDVIVPKTCKIAKGAFPDSVRIVRQ